MSGSQGLGLGLGNLSVLSSAETRSISPENFTGEKGRGGMSTEGTGRQAARDLGKGWKISPSIVIEPGATATLADIPGQGAIQHIWMTTHTQHWRELFLRMYWDDDPSPAVQAPIGDFFANGWGKFSQVSSLPRESQWRVQQMLVRRAARITIENLGAQPATLYYQVDYSLTELPAGAAYFHACWRRSNPLPYMGVHTLLDGITGSGHYVGTYIAWGVNNSGWWGEGEIKFYLDGDRDYPTICGTGTEDYFGGAWNFDVPPQGYTAFTTPFLGLSQILAPDGQYQSQHRFGMYRWHIMDPIRFKSDLCVTIQALGWRSGQRYLPLQDDIASTAFWYQQETASSSPLTPTADELEVI